MGMPPPVSTVHCCVCYSGSGSYPGEGVSFGKKGCLCCVRQRHKKKISYEGLPDGGKLLGGMEARRGLSVVGGGLALYMHIKFEVSSFNCFGDIEEIQKSESRSRNPAPDTI